MACSAVIPSKTNGRVSLYGVATISRLLKMIGLWCKRAQEERLYSTKETCNFKESTNGSHPQVAFWIKHMSFWLLVDHWALSIGSFDRIYGSFGRIYGSFGRMYGSFGRICCSFDRTYGSLDRMLGSFVQIYISWWCTLKHQKVYYRTLCVWLFSTNKQ